MGDQVTLVNPAYETARELKELLQQYHILNEEEPHLGENKYQFYVSDGAEKFKNVTNGIDHRRWVPQINPGLDGLLRDLIGEGYLTHPQELKKLEAYAGDKAVLQRLEDIKHQNKLAFAAFARKHQGVVLNTDAIFDVQVKRLHEYKRQLLNAL